MLGLLRLKVRRDQLGLLLSALEEALEQLFVLLHKVHEKGIHQSKCHAMRTEQHSFLESEKEILFFREVGCFDKLKIV